MQPRVEPGPGDIQYPTHCHHTPYSAVLIDKAVLQCKRRLSTVWQILKFLRE